MNAGRGSGPWAAGAAPTARGPVAARPTRTNSSATVANGCFWKHQLPADQLYFKHANKAYLETAVEMGFIESADPIVLQLYVEPLQRFRLSAAGHGPVVPPPAHRERISTYFDPLPFWYMPFEEAQVDRETFPLHALTQRPMQMYHSWHSQNAWLRQILGYNRLYLNRITGRALGLAEEDWVWVTSHHGRIRVPSRLMDGVNPDTVWTWNAHRQARRSLEPRAECVRIPQRLSPKPSDLGTAAGGWRVPLRQCRSDHRPGGVVRSAGADRASRAARSRDQRTRLPDGRASAVIAAAAAHFALWGAAT